MTDLYQLNNLSLHFMKFSQFITSALSAVTISAISLTSAQAEAPASYQVCAACHQPTGLGLPGVFPPLAGSEWVNGPAENLIRIQLRGLQGPITVKGVEYGNVPMAPNSTMTDDQIAEVLTYVRNAWGNKASAVTPDMVKALRSEVGKPMLTVADLIDPATAQKEPSSAEPEKLELKSGEFKEIQDESNGLPFWVFGFFGLCAVPVAISLVAKK